MNRSKKISRTTADLILNQFKTFLEELGCHDVPITYPPELFLKTHYSSPMGELKKMNNPKEKHKEVYFLTFGIKESILDFINDKSIAKIQAESETLRIEMLLTYWDRAVKLSLINY